MSDISVRLGLLRVQRHLSQRKLAELTGLRPDTISSLERGASEGIQFATLAKLCDALQCGPGDILALDTDADPVPVLGGPDEDTLILDRLAASGWPGLIDEPEQAPASEEPAAAGATRRRP